MNSIKTIIKFELARYFLSPLAYVYLISFLILSGSLAIYFGNFFINGEANLWALFDYQPWVYLLFIPGIAMRSWAEEFRSKSVVLLLTTPVSITNLVWGKFFASLIFAGIAILLTFPFWITINFFGEPDNAVIIVNYIGCILLAGAILAISQTMSALTKNSVIALVLAIFVNLLFFWSGFEYVLFWARELFSDTIVDTIISFSFLNHFSSLSRGLVELRDLIFFVSVIIFFNLLTIAVIRLRTKGTFDFISSTDAKHGGIVLTLLFIGFFGLNIIANNLFRQISYDFTEEKYLSLTKNTKDILRKLDRPVIAKLYYSPVLGKRNPQLRDLFDRIKLMLKQYRAYSNGKFDYRIYTPHFLDKVEDRAIADGIQPIPLVDINQNALFGVSFSDSLTGKSVIPFFSLERLSYLEQDFTTNIYKLQHKKKTLGLLSSLPLYGDTRIGDVVVNKWEIFNQISELYDVKVIKSKEELDQKFDVLMLVHPFGLEDDVIEKIKKHEKVFLVLDVADDASRLYSPAKDFSFSSQLSGLADYWGISFLSNGVVADFDNSITVDETINYKKNPSFTQDLLQFKVKKSNLNPNHRITYKLQNILFASASMVAPKNDSDVSFFPLITASNNSNMLSANLAKDNASPREILKQFSPSNRPIIIAAEFLSNSSAKPFDIIAVADTDFMYDSFWAKDRTFLDTTYRIALFDNANFVLNALDYLTKNDDLISLRGKNIKERSLFKIDNMRKLNIYRYKLKENDIFQAIDGVRSRLTEITAKKNFEERETFSADELAIIGNIRQEMNDLRQQLSDVRTKANDNIVSIEVWVKFFNIYFIVLVILCAILAVLIKHKKIKLFSAKSLLVWDKKTVLLFLWVMLISGVACLSVYFDNKNNISTYEDKLVFKDFSKKINNITKITLKNSSHTLTFEKKKGEWVLSEYPEFPVYQKRIRRFLTTLAQMTYAEKKSDKVEDMKYFGFSPLKNPKSPMTEVILNDKDGQQIEKFDIGWYDIDIGRGAKAAFIRLNNQFQVWLAEADFYDLSLNKNAWTYSSLWNLRFGRFISYNGIDEDMKVMTMVKILLNSYAEKIVDTIEGKKVFDIKILAENDNNVTLLFYKSEKNNKYYVLYDFGQTISGKHLEFFAQYVKGKYLEISADTWEKIYDNTTKK
ncbi:MAG: Gldg family protein [Alphaproteobacteria bacterium]|nr:Gldg family protein [Alphaproteobacteria bacterium]